MRILLGHSSPLDGGSGISAYVVELASAFLSQGHQVYLVGPMFIYDDVFDKQGIKCLSLGSNDEAIVAAQLIYDYLKDNNIDAIINNDNPYLQSLAPVVNVPFISVVHMSKTSVASLPFYYSEKVDYIVVIANDMRYKLMRKFNFDSYRLPIIYNGVAVAETRNVVRDKPKIIFTGGDNKKKGADILASSIIKNRAQWSDFEIKWFGSVSSRFVEKLSMPSIKFYGRVKRKELLNNYAVGDIFLLPSLIEGCPMSLLEAMSQGVVPIVSNGYGAMDHIVTSGHEGYVCMLDNFGNEALKAMIKLTESESSRIEMSNNSIFRINTDFNTSAMVSRFINIIENPTVDRSNNANAIDVLAWHRPLRKDGKKAPIVDRVRIKFGLLKKAGLLKFV